MADSCSQRERMERVMAASIWNNGQNKKMRGLPGREGLLLQEKKKKKDLKKIGSLMYTFWTLYSCEPIQKDRKGRCF